MMEPIIEHTDKCKEGIGHILRLMREFEARAHFELSEAILGNMSSGAIGRAKHRVLYNNGQRVGEALPRQAILNNLCDEHKEELKKINEVAREHYRMIFSFLEKRAK